jgi:hypothetical protein
MQGKLMMCFSTLLPPSSLKRGLWGEGGLPISVERGAPTRVALGVSYLGGVPQRRPQGEGWGYGGDLVVDQVMVGVRVRVGVMGRPGGG